MSKTIAAIATGNSVSGIGVIRISGERAIEIAQKVFKSADNTPLSSLKGYTAKFGNVYSKGEKYDNAIALVFRAPKSYTGEDVVELSVHGGIFIVEKTLESVLDAGASPAEAGEFTKRAFLNGKMDLTQAEAVATLISANGQEAAKASFNLLQGSLSNKISNVLDKIVSLSSSMAAWVDYPDEEIPELDEKTLKNTLSFAKNELKELLDNYESGMIMTQGVNTVIAGRPNAGKSTLMNMLSGKEKSIVTHIEGTTRDIVENSVRLGSLVLHLSDTAGLRESDTAASFAAVAALYFAGEKKLWKVSLVLAVFDSSRELDDDDKMLIDSCKGKKAVAVINKTDLSPKINTDKIKDNFESIVYISAKNNLGLKELETAVKNILGVEEFDSSAPLIANRRQKQCIQMACENINEALSAAEIGLTYDAINVMIDSAVDELLALTGKKATEEVVNNIFSRFCVGK